MCVNNILDSFVTKEYQSVTVFSGRASWRASEWLAWSKAEAAPPATSARSSRRTSSDACAACPRSTAWAKRPSSALGSLNMTPSTKEKRTSGGHRDACRSPLCPSLSSARSSFMRCSSRSWESRSLNISCSTTRFRSVVASQLQFVMELFYQVASLSHSYF